MKILVVEDDVTLSSHIKKSLKKEAFAVDVVATQEDGIFQSLEFEYDCIVLDLNLPDGNGLEICRALRTKNNKVPILILTARDALTDKVMGLNLGADEYVTKPIDTLELVARIRALIRRNSKDPSPILHIADLQIDPKTRRVKRGNIDIELPSKEYAILEFLAHHSDEVVTRSMLMDHVWGSDFETFSNVVDVYIRNLRTKIDRNFSKKLIHTIRGGGYVLSDTR